MAYRLKAHESISQGVQRIAYEQIDKALAQLLGQTDDSQEEAVHDARKRLKQLRALVRLVRDEIGSQTYHQENNCFRDAGRLLSDVRDAQVAIETLDDLTEHFAKIISANGFKEVRQALEARSQSISERVLAEKNAQDDAIRMIKEARKRVKHWSIKSNDWSTIESSLQRVYKRGDKGLNCAVKQPSVETFHDWRKRVKYLWYHLRILKLVWPDFMDQMASETKELADYLGDDHDLAMLRQLLKHEPKLARDRTQLDALLGLIDRRRLQLQQSAQFLGRRIYAEKPGVFVERIGVYWQVWRSELEQPIPAQK
ncbi:MAG: CHAD domain-containing protein [Coleofasciculus sp. G1-WW12-02]|uniref:CHAD domain-containing protein n=1 Tax=Coleofasciculus sp. G1-WW12-02 TaxID=3068483 RepID=UPI0032FD8A63